MSAIARVLDKLERLRRADQSLGMFGASRHQYRLGSPLAAGDLRRFELLHGITLPLDYRNFLLQAGNGGAGPYYGLVPLEDSVISVEPGFLARPFPYQHWWNGITPPNWWDLPGARLLDESTAPHQAGYFEVTHVQGTLRLAYEGCGYYRILVITGAERGHVWSDERAGDGGILPMPCRSGPYQTEGNLLIPGDGAEVRMTFLEWYEDWLETRLRRLSAIS